jgi:hypothetical protein
MAGEEVCVGIEMAVGPGDPAGMNVVDGVLRRASVPVFRPFGGQLGGDRCLGVAGCSMEEGERRVRAWERLEERIRRLWVRGW